MASRLMVFFPQKNPATIESATNIKIYNKLIFASNFYFTALLQIIIGNKYNYEIKK
jgi:hypothetical protein